MSFFITVPFLKSHLQASHVEMWCDHHILPARATHSSNSSHSIGSTTFPPSIIHYILFNIEEDSGIAEMLNKHLDSSALPSCLDNHLVKPFPMFKLNNWLSWCLRHLIIGRENQATELPWIYLKFVIDHVRWMFSQAKKACYAYLLNFTFLFAKTFFLFWMP